MKRIFSAVLVLVAGFSALGIKNVLTIPQPAAAIQPTTTRQTPLNTATPSPKPAEPTATVGYQATAMAAQSTADSAMRVMVEATLQHELRMSEQMQATGQAEAQLFLLSSWTATAASTAVPLTATAQAMQHEQTMARSTAISVQATQTAFLPTAIVSAEQARVMAEYAEMNALVEMAFTVLGGLAASLISVSVLVVVLRRPKVVVREVPAHEKPETRRIEIQRPTANGFQRSYTELPENLTDADMANVAGKLKLNKGNFVRSEMIPREQGNPLSRDQFDALRQWLQENGITTERELLALFNHY